MCATEQAVGGVVVREIVDDVSREMGEPRMVWAMAQQSAGPKSEGRQLVCPGELSR